MWILELVSHSPWKGGLVFVLFLAISRSLPQWRRKWWRVALLVLVIGPRAAKKVVSRSDGGSGGESVSQGQIDITNNVTVAINSAMLSLQDAVLDPRRALLDIYGVYTLGRAKYPSSDMDTHQWALYDPIVGELYDSIAFLCSVSTGSSSGPYKDWIDSNMDSCHEFGKRVFYASRRQWEFAHAVAGRVQDEAPGGRKTILMGEALWQLYETLGQMVVNHTENQTEGGSPLLVADMERVLLPPFSTSLWEKMKLAFVPDLKWMRDELSGIESYLNSTFIHLARGSAAGVDFVLRSILSWRRPG
jgi:hypothetical protein